MAPVFAVFVIVMVARRAGEYALVRPGREMLYTAVSAEQKYKAKNFIDTVVYRGGDALSAWMKRALDLLADQPTLAMVIGSGIALVSAAIGVALGRKHSRLETLAGTGKLEPPLIRECYVNFECRLYDDALIRKYNFFIFEVLTAHVASSPKHPETLHYRGEGRFMISGRSVSRRKKFRPENL